jgi:hypothetical protein
LIKSDVSGGLLKLGPENVNLKPTRTIRYQLQLKDLRELHRKYSVNDKNGVAADTWAPQTIFTGTHFVRDTRLIPW